MIHGEAVVVEDKLSVFLERAAVQLAIVDSMGFNALPAR